MNGVLNTVLADELGVPDELTGIGIVKVKGDLFANEIMKMKNEEKRKFFFFCVLPNLIIFVKRYFF